MSQDQMDAVTIVLRNQPIGRCGAYAVASAETIVGLVPDIDRRSVTRVMSVHCRLAPEYPYPTATDNALVAYSEVLVGKGGLA